MEAVAAGGGHLSHGRQGEGRTLNLRQICRQPAPDRDRGRHAGDRSRAAAARPSRHREIMGVGASGGGRSPARRSGSSSAPPAPTKTRSATAGTTPCCSRNGPSCDALVTTPLMRAMEDGSIAAPRGADAHGLRHAGHADHRAVGKDAADPRARRRP